MKKQFSFENTAELLDMGFEQDLRGETFSVAGVCFYMAPVLALITCRDNGKQLYTWEDGEEICYWMDEQINSLRESPETATFPQTLPF